MELEFAKLQGCGNDFVFLDSLSRNIELTGQQVRLLCDRHFGIGADGVILVKPSTDPACAAFMHYINADGSLSRMCGNGVRCFAKYLVDRGIVAASEGKLVVDTPAGPKPISFETDADGLLTCATVDMGRPVLDPAAVPVSAQADARSAGGVPYVGGLKLESPWGIFSFACISMGNPHAVCFVDEWDPIAPAAFLDPADKGLDGFDVDAVGSFFESHAAFPEKANIEFASVGEKGIAMRVFERGCGETLACGTGACATGVAATLTGRAGRENSALLRGGTLRIAWGDDDHVMMTGPARECFRGTVAV